MPANKSIRTSQSETSIELKQATYPTERSQVKVWLKIAQCVPREPLSGRA